MPRVWDVVDRLAAATGTAPRPGYTPGLRCMYHLWQPVPNTYR
jgi:hypothetical protein